MTLIIIFGESYLHKTTTSSFSQTTVRGHTHAHTHRGDLASSTFVSVPDIRSFSRSDSRSGSSHLITLSRARPGQWNDPVNLQPEATPTHGRYDSRNQLPAPPLLGITLYNCPLNNKRGGAGGAGDVTAVTSLRQTLQVNSRTGWSWWDLFFNKDKQINWSVCLCYFTPSHLSLDVGLLHSGYN